MKKFSKILCAVLVLAILCSSLAFVINASEEEPVTDAPYTSTPTTDVSTIFAAIKYGAEDNRLSSASFSTETNNGWNNPNARQAHLVTNNKTGDVYYHEFVDGQFDLKAGITGGNEYVNYTFNSVNLKYTAGYNEYIIVEYDVAYSPNTGKYTIPATGESKDSDPIKQEVIPRGVNSGTSWCTVQKFSELGLSDGFSHVTTVYDYTSGDAFVYVNGKLAKQYTNGAFNSTHHSNYLGGETYATSEWRIGSNSYDDIYFDNVYIRYFRNVSTEDTIATAIKSGKLSDWDANIYDDDYQMPTPHWFVKTVAHNNDDFKNIKNYFGATVDSGVSGNYFSGSGYANAQSQIAIANSVTSKESYVTFYAKSDGVSDKKNCYYQIDTTGAPNIAVGSSSSAYYVIDFDIATYSEMLPYLDISVMLRRVSDGGGFPFSCNVEVANYITEVGKWAHITIVGDIGANQVYVYVDGKYVANPGYAYNASQLSGNTSLSPKGIRVDFTLSNIEYNFSKGQSITLDNFSERIYTDAKASGGLSDAVAVGDLLGWKNYVAGNGGNKLPSFVSVNGVEYNTTVGMDKVLFTNDDLDIEFLATHFMPLTLNANAVINTNGLDFEDLITFHPDCQIKSVDGNIVTTKAKYLQNIRIEEIKIPGQNRDVNIYNAVKYDTENNLFTDVYHHSATKDGYLWGTPGYRQASFLTNVDTGEVMYRESAILNADGKMNEGTNEYVNFNFSAVNLKYTPGTNEYIVADFDFGYESVINDDISVQLIPRYKNGSEYSGAWAKDVVLRELPVNSGEIAHITLVFDFTNNYAHVFVNGTFVYSIDDGAMDDEFGGAKNVNLWTDKYLTGSDVRVSELKLTSDHRTSSICLDNMAIRSFKYSAAEDSLIAAVNSKDITNWSESIYNYNYRGATFPAVAIADGVEYGSIEALNEALVKETDGVKNVELLHTPVVGSVIKLHNDTIVDTNTLEVGFDWETGVYAFKHSDPLYVSTETGLAYASNRLVVIHNEGDTVYHFASIDQYNCMKYATPVQWCYDQNFNKVDVYFYVFGDAIVAPECPPYVEDGKMYVSEWCESSTEGEIGNKVATFPVASSEYGELWYMLNVTVTDFDYSATDLKYGASVSTGIELTLYVNKDQTVTEGKIVNIDGKDYVAIVTHIAPHKIDEIVTVEFEVRDFEGNVHVQRQELCFVDYAKALLEDEANSDSLKKLVVSLLNYANEAHALFENGATMGSVDALLEVYGAYELTSKIGESVDTTSLKSVIRSAAMRLNARPEFVFKVARGFKGLVTFTYTGVSGEVTVVKGVDATFSEKLVTLDGVDVRDVACEFSITLTAYGTDEVVATGSYSFATYIHALENIDADSTDFAKALAAYSKAALEYTGSDVVIDV